MLMWLLDCLQELDNLIHSGNTSTTQKLDILNSRNVDATEELDNILHSGNANATADFHRSDIYRDLADLGNLGRVEVGFNLSNEHDSLYTMDEIFELGDLDRPLNSDTSMYNLPSLHTELEEMPLEDPNLRQFWQ